MMFKNEQKIDYIEFKPKKTHNFCPLGQKYLDENTPQGRKKLLPHYTNQFTIKMRPNEIIMDYCDVEIWLEKNICDKDLIIEDCVAMLYDYLMKTYEPFYLNVQSYVDDAVHGPVSIMKEGFGYEDKKVSE